MFSRGGKNKNKVPSSQDISYYRYMGNLSAELLRHFWPITTTSRKVQLLGTRCKNSQTRAARRNTFPHSCRVEYGLYPLQRCKTGTSHILKTVFSSIWTKPRCWLVAQSAVCQKSVQTSQIAIQINFICMFFFSFTENSWTWGCSLAGQISVRQ